MTASMPRPALSVSAEQRLRSIDELDAEIATIARQLNAQTYRLLVLVREFDDRLGFAKWSFASCAEWLAWRLGLSLSAAREKVRAAHALRDLGQIAKAFSQGRLSYSKVRALTRVANARNEDLLLAYAMDATAAQVEERCRQMRNIAPESTDIARRAWERRSMTILRQAEAGTMRITLEVPIEDGELFARAIDRAVEVGKGNLGPEFETSGWCAEQADAAIEIARSYLDGDASAASAADRFQVVVHVDEMALAANTHRESAESLRGGISHRDGAVSSGSETARSDLPIETIRRLTCDGSIARVVDNAKGNPLDIGRKSRVVPTALKRALHGRDRGCTFPGCHRDHYVDAHHLKHWADGGETSEKNLTLLCTLHHRLVHEGRFSVRRDAEGELCFARHDGRVIPRCGYQQSDYTDENVGEVREPRGLYLVT